MFNKASKYWAMFQIGQRNASVYFMDWWSVGLLVAIRVAVLTQLYAATFTSVGLQVVDGFTLSMVIWSVMVANALQLSSGTRQMILELQNEIKSGNVAHTLSKPYSLVTYFILQYFGRFQTKALAAVSLGAVAAAFFAGVPQITVLGIICGIILSSFGFLINAAISMGIGLTAFWVEDISGFRWIYDKFQWVLSGMVIPLAFLPDGLRLLIEYSPFGQLFYSAGRILVDFEAQTFWQYLGTQVFWLLVLLYVVTVIYRKGIKNVSVNGG